MLVYSKKVNACYFLIKRIIVHKLFWWGLTVFIKCISFRIDVGGGGQEVPAGYGIDEFLVTLSLKRQSGPDGHTDI